VKRFNQLSGDFAIATPVMQANKSSMADYVASGLSTNYQKVRIPTYGAGL
jgi:hypothetical protein